MNYIIILALFFATTITSYGQETKVNPVNTRFMVFSDPHYFDPSLGTEGKAFQEYLDGDRKLLKESKELVLEAVKLINSSDAEFVLIPGDLTKDGELQSHKAFAELIGEIEKQGKQVYVIPGNHDISNGESKSFKGDSSFAVQNVNADEFRNNYSQFGFDEALYKDSHSLSYVVEPSEGLWIIGLDACMYQYNQPGYHPHTDGILKEETREWVKDIAELASVKGKKIIAFMHHGILEHYEGQEKFYGEYIVNDFESISKEFASLGINVVFTGHYHAQDITLKKWKDGTFICDIETGSLVTYPCPVREIALEGNILSVSSHFIEKTEQHPLDFTTFSKEYVHSGIAGIAEKTLISYKLKPSDAKKVSGQIADAFLAHYEGDETVPSKYLDVKGVGIWGRIILKVKKGLIVGLYNDLLPADNSVVIDLNNGEVKP